MGADSDFHRKVICAQQADAKHRTIAAGPTILAIKEKT